MTLANKPSVPSTPKPAALPSGIRASEVSEQVMNDPAAASFFAAIALIFIAAIVGIILAMGKEQSAYEPGKPK